MKWIQTFEGFLMEQNSMHLVNESMDKAELLGVVPGTFYNVKLADGRTVSIARGSYPKGDRVWWIENHPDRSKIGRDSDLYSKGDILKAIEQSAKERGTTVAGWEQEYNSKVIARGAGLPPLPDMEVFTLNKRAKQIKNETARELPKFSLSIEVGTDDGNLRNAYIILGPSSDSFYDDGVRVLRIYESSNPLPIPYIENIHGLWATSGTKILGNHPGVYKVYEPSRQIQAIYNRLSGGSPISYNLVLK